MVHLKVGTNTLLKKLEQWGFSRTQAEALVSVAQELDISNVASKMYRNSASHYNERFIAKRGASWVRNSLKKLS
jgi:hypothetical protein